MIIGISGKIGSGKDTIGKIIQYLTSSYHGEYAKDCMTFKEWVNESHGDFKPWKIKKFAYKLKQIVSLLTGISVKDLEKQEVKDRVLGEEWLIWKEESTFDPKFKKLHLDEPLTFGICKKVQYTVRQLLQEIGTEAMRDIIHPNIWVNALFADYKVIDDNKRTSLGNVIDYSQCTFPNWIITDMRFPNELKAIKDRGGITIRVNRQPITGGQYYQHNMGMQHPSETALDNANFDYVINNNGTIEELVEKVRDILIKEKIIC